MNKEYKVKMVKDGIVGLAESLRKEDADIDFIIRSLISYASMIKAVKER